MTAVADSNESRAADATRDTSDLLLELTNISKRFPGVIALEGVDFDLRRGEVHVLFGENGAEFEPQPETPKPSPRAAAAPNTRA